MRILLLGPPAPKECRPVISPPLGLGYIAGVAARAGYEINLVDCSNLNYDRCAQIVENNSPDVVGITCNTGIRHESFRLAKLVKAISPNSLIVMGGPHASALPELILRHYGEVDVVVRGEGEETFLDLLRKYESPGSGNGLRSVRGLSYRDGGRIIHTQDRDSIKDLDTLPFPAWRFFDLDEYNKNKNVEKFDVRAFLNVKAAPMITSRGCPYLCTFCYSDFWGKRYRARSAASVASEMEYLNSSYGVEYIRFFDDDFIFSRKRATEICQEIIRRGLDKRIVWRCEARVDHADEELFRRLRAAGCHMLEFGIESGSQKILDNLKKGITVQQIRDAFRLAHKAGVETKALLMLGNPGETVGTIKETIRLLREIKPTYTVAALLAVMPSTKICDEMLSHGEIEENTWLDERVLFPLYTVDHSERQIDRMILFYKVGSLVATKDVRRLLQGALNRYVFGKLRGSSRSQHISGRV